MALRRPTPGLRSPFVNDSHDIVRVELRVPPGSVIEVDEAVAAQLPAAFKDPDVVAERDAARAPKAEEESKKAKKAKVDQDA